MKSVDDLTEGDYIAFGFNYNGPIPNEIIVSDVMDIKGDDVLVCFLYGYHSLAEVIKKENILAIRNNETGEGKIKGWSGKYDILHPRKIKQILTGR
ncbi:Uncharacterised protein [uncultured archaeon]|nr:Uncharacterised protein [uncultured archaeon]